MATITIDFELTPDDFADIIDAAASTLGYWTKHVDFLEPYDANDPPSTLTIVDQEGDKHKITTVEIEKAMTAISNGDIDISLSIRQYIILAIKENDMGHIDSAAADAIIQVACFGEIVYG